ncbi:hypothetical protein K493DRAFT_335678 [Basidiobolus meristosporus CBS 931.73]|uniref:Protein UNC80 C-terminal domain-containing protein n=1 Tax=Basidiobolus meristosporus CBS 931.73 TaxID=1314790 RepID=A0A1Y1YNT1_9FUNG|nr:hypothetical protein K493DRAFT_335678 [Basidiobolus meristosporus CBS 931.73]|eukprot:ORX99662.1 hypothetical protein K493DRAFT_335678 [Basidiobolus meristosporus CBS 931.73]
MKALDIYEYIRVNFSACGPQNYYSQIIWCCQQLVVPQPILRFRVVALFEKIFNSIFTSALHPIPANVIFVMVINCVKLLVTIKSSNTISNNQIDKGQDRFIPDKIRDFFTRLCSGRTVSGAPLKPDAIKSEGHIRSYGDEVLTKYILIDGLVRCLSFEEAAMKDVVLDFLAEFVTPKLVITPYYDQILSKLARITSSFLLNADLQDVNISELSQSFRCRLIYFLDLNLPLSYERLSPTTVQHIAQAFITGLYLKETLSPHPIQRRGSNSPLYEEEKFSGKNGNAQLSTLERCIKDRLISIWNDGHKDAFVKSFQMMITRMHINEIVPLYWQVAFELKDHIGSDFVKATLPSLFSKVVGLRVIAEGSLSLLLLELARVYPQSFYKPFLICASTNSYKKIVKCLQLLDQLKSLIGGERIFLHDVDFVTVLLLNNVNLEVSHRLSQNGKTEALRESNPPMSDNVTLGQLIMVQEFIWFLQDLKKASKTFMLSDPQLNRQSRKLLIEVEKRISLYLAAWEASQSIAISIPFRVLYCQLLKEIRLFCKHTTRPAWLQRTIAWLKESDLTPVAPHRKNSSDISFHTHDQMEFTITKFQEIYKATVLDKPTSEHPLRKTCKNQTSFRGLSRTPPEWCPVSADTPTSEQLSNPTVVLAKLVNSNNHLQISSRCDKLAKASYDLTINILSLLVTSHICLHEDDLLLLLDYLWSQGIMDARQSKLELVAFLFNYCGEKVPDAVTRRFHQCLHNGDNAKLDAIRKMYIIFSQRGRIHSQHYITDQHRRKPFKAAGHTVTFVSTDLGSPTFTASISSWLSELSTSNMSWKELQTIQELGWKKEDSSSKRDINMYALTLLPTVFFDYQLDSITAVENSHKSRAVVVSSILENMSFNSIYTLFDPRVEVSVSMWDCVSYFTRDDPSVFLRKYLEGLSSQSIEHQCELLGKLRSLILFQKKHSPSFTYILFNYLTGLLKWHHRDNRAHTLPMFAHVLPIIAELIPSSNELSIREFRKNKIEWFFNPTSEFWPGDDPSLASPADVVAPGPTSCPSEIPNCTFQMTMLRIAQIHFMFNFVSRYPREAINVNRVVESFSPIPWENRILEFDWDELNSEAGFTQNQNESKISNIMASGQIHGTLKSNNQLRLLSALQCRAWMHFMETIVFALPNNFNDREELERILSDVNSVLKYHGDDLGLVTQALVLYINVSASFRRLFTSSRGYHLFVPALFQGYFEAYHSPAVQSSIEYAWARFYSLHEDSFILQALGCLVPIILKARTKAPKIGALMTKSLFKLFGVLEEPPLSDLMGIGQSAMTPSGELISSNIPEVQMRSLHKVALSAGAGLRHAVLGKTYLFTYHDLFRLFMTVIAYDPSSIRSEQFLKVLSSLLPLFVEKSASLRNFAVEGISALIPVFLKFSRGTKSSHSEKPFGNMQSDSTGFFNDHLNDGPLASIFDVNQKRKKHWQHTNRIPVKLEFLKLIETYAELGLPISNTQRNELYLIARSILRDQSALRNPASTEWLGNFFCRTLLPVTDLNEAKESVCVFLRLIGIAFRAYHKCCDFSGLFRGLSQLIRHFEDKLSTEILYLLRDKFIAPALAMIAQEELDHDSPSFGLLCDSLVALFITMMAFTQIDLFQELNKVVLTPTFMKFILIPICMKLTVQNSTGVLTPVITDAHRHKYREYWLRMIACLKRDCLRQLDKLSKLSMLSSNIPTTPVTELVNTTAIDQSLTQHTFVTSAMLMLHFIAFKIIFVRGEKHLNEHPEIWKDISYFMKKVFSQSHLLDAESSGHSNPTSPQIDPRGHQPNLIAKTSLKPFEYVMWSFFEFLTLYKHPLLMYFQGFISNKLPSNIGRVGYRGILTRDHSRSSSPLSPRESSSQPKWRCWGGASIVDSFTRTESYVGPASLTPTYLANKSSPNLSASPMLDCPSQTASKPDRQKLTIHIPTRANTPSIQDAEAHSPLSFKSNTNRTSSSFSPTTPRRSSDTTNAALSTTNKLTNQTLSIISNVQNFFHCLSKPPEMINQWDSSTALEKLRAETAMVVSFFPTLFAKEASNRRETHPHPPESST